MLQVGKQKYTLISINQLDIFSVAESALQKKPRSVFLYKQKFYIFKVAMDKVSKKTLGFILIKLIQIINDAALLCKSKYCENLFPFGQN